MWNEVQTAYFDKLRLRQIYLQKEAIAFLSHSRQAAGRTGVKPCLASIKCGLLEWGVAGTSFETK
jgi:hypothetical protein